MKKLTTYLNERLVVNQRFDEKLVINKNYNPYTCAPKSFKELRKIIEQRYKEQGPGTEQKPIDFNDINVGNIDSFWDGNRGLFEKTKFEYIDISDWDVSNVTDLGFMFSGCKQLKSVGDLSNWDVSKIEYMGGMFAGCENLKSVGDLSRWDVSNTEDISGMFGWCENLKSVGDLSRWDVSNTEDISGMFRGCKELKSVGDLSKWDVSKVEHMNQMFYNSGITNIPKWR